ncbi:MAG: ATP synthase F1 subunit delta [Holosporaceae bacterium]|jgi:F-type H+-transporting ATPase subunit delta|nr:ATP synthase F1 subunit delta [Holosporaceae bacterium]
MGAEITAINALASRYVGSLHAAAVDMGLEQLVSEQLRSIKKMIMSVGNHEKFLKKLGLLKSIGLRYVEYLKNTLELCGILGNFLDILALNGRINMLPEICDAYEALVDKIAGRKRIFLTFAREIPAQEQSKLRDDLADVFGKNVEYHVHIDPSIIDGFKVQHRSKILDYSIKSKIRRLQNAIGREDDED